MIESRRGRIHDAEGSREAILNAAEREFASHGFSGTRIDAIAASAGYNKSLIFHYYDDKLGLYAAVLQRIETYIHTVRTQILGIIDDDFSNLDAQMFKTLLSTVVRTIFDVLQERPNLQHILNWEAAEEWKTIRAIITQFDVDDIPRVEKLLHKGQEIGILRSDLDIAVLLPFVLTVCLSYQTFSPLYHAILARGETLPANIALYVREQLVRIVLEGSLTNP